MNNVKTAIRRFFTNKNTVTIIGVLLGIVILYVGYNYRINSQINPTSVPYATQRIKPKTKITSEMIVGRYANADTVIPQGSLFYKGSVVEKDELPDSIIYDYPDGYVLVNMSVNTTNTYGNKIYPGNYIDIYLKIVKQDFVTDSAGNTTTQQTEDKIMIGKLLENVQVIDVLDSNGASVFEDLEDIKTPAQIIFAVPEEYHILLRKTMYLRTYEATLIPVPTNEGEKKNPGEVAIANNELKDFINQITVWTEDNSGDITNTTE